MSVSAGLVQTRVALHAPSARPQPRSVRRPLPVRRPAVATRAAKQDDKAANEPATEAEEQPEDKSGPKIDFTGVKQLIMMGMGTVAGDITEINLNDPKRTVVMELEANNFEDADGKPISYIQDQGYVDDSDTGFKPLNLLLPLALGGASLFGVYATLKALS
mmetsp:Transcript_9003/g.16218  ORF Transcript_9003/g.16218 Transcript_9003/m.16218 type:complete len:161 (-) Transcript_9003:134-616(-)|eukprot:CAMPEP_0177770860 /NCGR_PEP_ID=MMETSP0491_2-20121128/11199_1 /TAXON_ID=63592 /ORGANISM="Tetraselmis chuii, Strain PLY429" /LENGTH=160 /DNA_ID=CAMNT_0019288201 /DNA_START=179 /DNA_END=661 /DNA_ORIENTATION=-